MAAFDVCSWDNSLTSGQRGWELAVLHARDKPHAVALWVPRRRSGGSTTFGELLQRTMQMQQTLLAHGTGPGATVLLVDGLGPRLYATVLAVLSLGASVMLVEPWMIAVSMTTSLPPPNPSPPRSYFRSSR